MKISHKYTVGDSKGYEGFSRILIELANEKVHDKRADKVRGVNDIDTDAVDTEVSHLEHPDYAEKENSEQEFMGYEAKFQGELNWLGTCKIKGQGGKGNGKGSGKGGKGGKPGACVWCEDL